MGKFFPGEVTFLAGARYHLIMFHQVYKPLIMAALIGVSPVAVVFSQKSDLKDSVQEDIKPALPHIYELPYLPGKKVSIVQGYNGWWSHQGEKSLDFLMRKGETICAARGGTVISCRSDSKKGGPSYKYISDGNYIIIKHDDSTCAAYWHLQCNGVMVKSGDTVVAGQPIGKVGSTGFSSGPHLHFEVYYYDKTGKYHTIPTLFNTTRGAKKPRAWHFYKRPPQ